MKIPLVPPPWTKILAQADQDSIGRMLAEHAPMVRGAYLHWDQLRHRAPPEGLTSERWWAAIKMARAGMLRPLPLVDNNGQPFNLAMPEPILIHLHHIDKDAAGHIQASTEVTTPENRDRYLFQSMIEEAITSSQLEGAATTRRVAEDMLREGRKPRDHSEHMIFNNFRAMEFIRSIRAEPITPERIFDLHRLLVEETLENSADAGRLRRTNDIHVADNRDGTILHQPPDHTELPERLERLCRFANADENSTPFVHPVLRAILLHFMIGYDHPFVDGNGRTARALFYWSMARSGYWLTEFISISHFLHQAPSQYVRAYLHTETDDNDTTYFLIHQLEVIRKAIRGLYEYLERKIAEQKTTEQILAGSSKLRHRLNHRQLALLTHALKHPGETYKIEGHQRSHGVVYQTARTDLLALNELELLEKERVGKSFIFFAPEALRKKLETLANRSLTEDTAPQRTP